MGELPVYSHKFRKIPCVKENGQADFQLLDLTDLLLPKIQFHINRL